jgi:hypothetical protein
MEVPWWYTRFAILSLKPQVDVTITVIAHLIPFENSLPCTVCQIRIRNLVPHVAERAARRGAPATFGSCLLADLQSQSSNGPVELSSDSFSNALSLQMACQINFIWQNLSPEVKQRPHSVLET